MRFCPAGLLYWEPCQAGNRAALTIAVDACGGAELRTDWDSPGVGHCVHPGALLPTYNQMKALLIIDMIVRDVKKRSDRKSLISSQLKLILAFKKAKQKIILAGGDKSGKPSKHVNPVMLRLWGHEESKNPKENKVIPELLNSYYDYYINKKGYSAFFKTKLESICKKEKIKEIYLAGIYSGVCVYFSAADAAMRGILPILVTDASGAPNKKLHKLNISRYTDILGPAITTNKVLKKLH